MHGVAATTDFGVEPSVHIEKQILEPALRDKDAKADGERMVIGPLLRRASPVHSASPDARMFMLCSYTAPSQDVSDRGLAEAARGTGDPELRGKTSDARHSFRGAPSPMQRAKLAPTVQPPRL